MDSRVGGEGPASPRQAVILAAGRGSRLAPYTDVVPTALITVADRPIVAHTVEALRRQGVDKFVICRGWLGECFDEHAEEFGDGITFVDCPRFSSTGMLETMRLAAEHLDAGGFYVVYGDILFRPSVAQKLREADSALSIVVHGAAPGVQSKGFADVEAVTTTGVGSSRLVRRIGKNRRIKQDDMAGEFAGMFKVGATARDVMDEALARLWLKGGSGTGDAACSSIPWWLEPVETASLCDMLQLLADEGATIAAVKVFGGWHEVNMPEDLQRAQNDTAVFLSDEDIRSQVAAMGACLLSEANDLKRPLATVAKELNVDISKLECLLRGDLDIGDALEVLRRMSEVYPVPLNDLWLDADDTTGGVRLCTAVASEATARILDRPDGQGGRSPYYEYRDAAMSRCSQFRPEWIKELRYVPSGDPKDPQVQMNNGHLMMQTTLFVGPVDFYYTDRHGVVRREAMNTGDSNFITPFVPHSFTAREASPEAIIIAVTFGGHVRRAFAEFSRTGANNVSALSGDLRDAPLARRSTLNRCMASECMTPEELAKETAPRIDGARLHELLQGEEPLYDELEVLANVLNVRVADLLVCPMKEEQEVVVTRSVDSRRHARQLDTYTLAPLARTPHQPDLKTFDLEVLDSATPGATLSCGLHTFVYHFGSEPIQFSWEGCSCGRKFTAELWPGDSAYIAPTTKHRFSVLASQAAGRTKPKASTSGTTSGAAARANPNGAGRGEGRRLFLVRIPGHLYNDTLLEFATYSASGRERVGRETIRWYN